MTAYNNTCAAIFEEVDFVNDNNDTKEFVVANAAMTFVDNLTMNDITTYFSEHFDEADIRAIEVTRECESETDLLGEIKNELMPIVHNMFRNELRKEINRKYY